MNMYQQAKKHLEECSGCENCIWFEESAYAISEYGIPVKKAKVDMPRKSEKADYFVRKKLGNNKHKHPLYDFIMDKFKGEEI